MLPQIIQVDEISYWNPWWRYNLDPSRGRKPSLVEAIPLSLKKHRGQASFVVPWKIFLRSFVQHNFGNWSVCVCVHIYLFIYLLYIYIHIQCENIENPPGNSRQKQHHLGSMDYAWSIHVQASHFPTPSGDRGHEQRICSRLPNISSCGNSVGKHIGDPSSFTWWTPIALWCGKKSHWKSPGMGNHIGNQIQVYIMRSPLC